MAIRWGRLLSGDGVFTDLGGTRYRWANGRVERAMSWDEGEIVNRKEFKRRRRALESRRRVQRPWVVKIGLVSRRMMLGGENLRDVVSGVAGAEVRSLWDLDPEQLETVWRRLRRLEYERRLELAA